MSPDINNHIVRRQYLAHKGEDLLSQVQKVVCLVTPNSFISAGYHPSGEVLLVNSARQDRFAWDAKFVEYELLNDVLFAAPELIKSIFVASTKNMMIPDELFQDKETAQLWLQKIYHCEANEELNVTHFDSNQLYCTYAFERSIQEVFDRYTTNVKVLPLTLTHFKNKMSDVVQCTIVDGFAKATLHHKNQLLWHQTFEYETAEDILYQLTAACQEHQIDIQEYLLSFTTASIEEYPIFKGLKQYFPNFKSTKTGIADIIAPEWSSTVFLFQQLYGCA
jgi:hypothetical protein